MDSHNLSLYGTGGELLVRVYADGVLKHSIRNYPIDRLRTLVLFLRMESSAAGLGLCWVEVVRQQDNKILMAKMVKL